MAVWSVSQGKYIDSPSAGGTGGGAGTPDIAKMKQLYALQILKAAKKPADIVTAFSLLEPSAAELKTQEKKKELDTEKNNKLSDIDRAIELISGEKSGKKVKTGKLAGTMLKLRVGLLGGGSQQDRELYNLLSGLAAEKMFSVGGKALTGPERAILAPLVPSATIPNQTNVTNLKELRNKITGQYDAYNPATEEMAPSGTNAYLDGGDFIPD
jgi:hypothetical protein